MLSAPGSPEAAGFEVGKALLAPPHPSEIPGGAASPGTLQIDSPKQFPPKDCVIPWALSTRKADTQCQRFWSIRRSLGSAAFPLELSQVRGRAFPVDSGPSLAAVGTPSFTYFCWSRLQGCCLWSQTFRPSAPSRPSRLPGDVRGCFRDAPKALDNESGRSKLPVCTSPQQQPPPGSTSLHIPAPPIPAN